MKQEFLLAFAIERVNPLLIIRSTKGGSNQRLGLPTGKERRTVNPRQKPYLTGNRSDGFCVTAINTLAILDYVLTDELVFQVANETLNLLVLTFIVGRERSNCLINDRINGNVPLLLGDDTDSILDA